MRCSLNFTFLLKYKLRIITFLRVKKWSRAAAAPRPGVGRLGRPQEAAKWAAAALATVHPVLPCKKRRRPRDAADAYFLIALLRTNSPSSAAASHIFVQRALLCKLKTHCEERSPNNSVIIRPKRNRASNRPEVQSAAINATKSALWCCTLAEPPRNPQQQNFSKSVARASD